MSDKNRPEEHGSKVPTGRAQLVEPVLDGLVTVDRHGLITDVDQQVVKLTGFTRPQLVGSRFADHSGGTQLKHSQASLRQRARQLQALSHRLVQAQEKERRSLARELHDVIGQELTGLKLMLEAAPLLAGPEMAEHLSQAQDLVRQLMRRVRALCLDLRPPVLEEFGLVPALEWHFDRYTAHTGVHVAFDHQGLESRLTPETEIAVFRVVQEALTNVARHTKARRVKVVLSKETGKLRVRIADRGKGFNTSTTEYSRTSTGLSGMREGVVLLGGRLSIISKIGSGTTVEAELPAIESKPAAGHAA